jgi:hypothetical protein
MLCGRHILLFMYMHVFYVVPLPTTLNQFFQKLLGSVAMLTCHRVDFPEGQKLEV